MQRLLLAFRNSGYSQLTMIDLADACDLTRRALYNHFSSKEDAFRGTIRWNHVREIRTGWEAGEAKLAEGGSALDVIVAILDARYGEARRYLELSPHSSDLNVEAFRRCRDILEESALVFQTGLAEVVVDLEKRDLLRLRPHQTASAAAQLIADGARGVNQTLPNQTASTLPERYRAMCEALMYGFAETSIIAMARTGKSD
jgi:AcrR family transcriptional regulator